MMKLTSGTGIPFVTHTSILIFIGIKLVASVSITKILHLLLVPKKLIVRIGEADSGDQELLGHLLTRIRLIADQEGLSEDGFRVVINNGRDGGEAVPHLHLHILAGRQLSWPPG